MKNNKVLICAISVCALILCMAAGVNGIFNSVTSTHGYMVGGSAGSSGQTICSDGTYFDTPCSLYYQMIQEIATPLAQQPVLNFDGTVVASAGSGKTNIGLPNVGTSGTYTSPVSLTTDAQGRVQSITAGSGIARTCNSYGCYEVSPEGTITEWGSISATGTGDGGSFTLTYPYPFTNTTNQQIIFQSQSCNIGTPSSCASGAGGSNATQPFAHAGSYGTSASTIYWWAQNTAPSTINFDWTARGY